MRGGERGQSTLEYLGVAVVVALLVGGIAGFAPGLGGAVAAGICQVAGLGCGAVDDHGSSGGGALPPDDRGAVGGGGGGGGGGAWGPDEDEGSAGGGGGGGVWGPDEDEGSAGGGGGGGAWAPGDVGAAIAQLEALQGADPQAVADAIAAMDPAVVEQVLGERPDLLAATGGVPLDLRYEANRRLIAHHADDLRGELAAIEGQLDGAHPAARARLEQEAAALREQIAQLDEWAASDRQFLWFDPADGGRVAEVIGDLAAADQIAYVVPGVTADPWNFDGYPRGWAEQIQAAAQANDPSAEVATIALLGYDAPEQVASMAAITDDRAVAATGDVVAFTEGVAFANPDAEVTLIGHSYGSVAVSAWERGGVEADRVVFVGSPGVRADSADEFGADVYVGLTPDDPIDWVSGIDIGGLGHGTDPASEGFGGVVFETGEASGHAGYVDEGTESLTNIGWIVLGQDDQVTRRGEER